MQQWIDHVRAGKYKNTLEESSFAGRFDGTGPERPGKITGIVGSL
jgi:hypothetical protein